MKTRIATPILSNFSMVSFVKLMIKSEDFNILYFKKLGTHMINTLLLNLTIALIIIID